MDVLRARASHQANRCAYTFLRGGEHEEDRVTYSQLDQSARSIGSSIQELGGAGERIVLLVPQGIEFLAAFLGCLYAGAVAVPCYPPGSQRMMPRIGAIVEDARPFAAVVARAALPRIRAWLCEVLGPGAPVCLAIEDLAAGNDEDWRPPSLDGEALAFLQYTSGSTTSPRGVMVSHASLCHNERMIQRAFATGENSVVVGWLPLFHDMGLIGNVLQPLWAGCPSVLMSPVAFLQRPVRWLQAISRYRATVSGGPNFAYDLCVRKIDLEREEDLELGSWEVAFNGAEPVRPETLDRFAAAFAGRGFRRSSFLPCYGLAEATLLVSGGSPSAPPTVRSFARRELEGGGAIEEGDGVRLAGCGRPPEDLDLAIVDPAAEEPLGPGRVGEIWVAGPSACRGYWQRPEETAVTFGGRLQGHADVPFLRTGDLGFRTGDGELFVTGRLKDLVILRGRNHYPQDIELSVEASHPALRTGAAFAVEVEREERLVAVHEVDAGSEADLAAIADAARRAVAQEHEVVLYELVLIPAGRLPRTSSGKVQRRVTRERLAGGDLGVLGRSTLSATKGGDPEVLVPDESGEEEGGERGLLEVFRQSAALLLGLPGSGLDPRRPLTAYGLDSITAVEFQHEIWLRTGVALPLASLLDGASLEALAALASAGSAAPAVPFQAAAAGPLSYEQRALWFLDRLAPGSAAYHIAGAALVADLDVERLRGAFRRLVERHPSLRTSFPTVGGEPVQWVHDTLEVPLTVEDAAEWDGALFALRLREEAERGFDLETGPLLRLALYALSTARYAVLFVAHHGICDFWSLGIAVRELGELYARPESGLPPPPAATYLDHVERQRLMLVGERGEALWQYWRRELAGDLPVADLPADRPRPPVQTYEGESRAFVLATALGSEARALGAAHGATLYMVLLAAFQALAARVTGREQVLIGSPTAGRETADMAGVIGDFANPVVLRADLAGDPSFEEMVARARRTALGAFAHRDYPFGLLAEHLRPARDPSRSPIFQIGFVFYQDPSWAAEGLSAFALGVPGVEIAVGPLRLESLAVRPRAAQFDLMLHMGELEAGLAGSLVYNRDLFDGTTVARFAAHLQVILEAAVVRPDLPLSGLPLLAEAERHQLTREWNDTRAERLLEGTLPGLFLEQVARSPGAEAVVFAAGSLTYDRLNRLANRLANRLRTFGVGPETLVAVAVERSLEMVWGLFGILKAGAAYVPVDPDYPAERIAYMLADCRAPVLLVTRRAAASLPPYDGALLYLDELGEADEESEEEPAVEVLPDHLAYAIYTSGSTGRPKAALNTHTSIVNRLLWMQEEYRLTARDRVLQKTPFSFDVSVWELFWPLLCGAKLVVARPGGHQDAAYLARLIPEEGITVLHFVPSMLEVFLDEPAAAGCGCLERVICSGEALPFALQERFFSLLGVRLHNLYGPTEAAVDVTHWNCRREGGRRLVPIGRPIANTAIHLLDRELRPVPAGVAGELCIAGVGLARGYLGRSDLTAERFVPHSVAEVPGARLYRTGDLARFQGDGVLEFLGRIDHQVKLRGFRIEPEEIESALRGHAGIKSAAVLVHEFPGGDRRLVAYVVPAGEGATSEELRRHLLARLPDYMVPAAFLPLAELPLSPNGKLNRRALLALEAGGPVLQEPAHFRTPLEEIVAGSLASVLGREHVGRHEDFFAAGGHSLLAVRALGRIGAAIGREIPVTALFHHPTTAGLARSLEAVLASEKGEAVLPVRPAARREAMPLSFAQQRLWFLDHLEPGSPLYNCPLAVRLNGALNLPALAASLVEVRRRHEVLRTTFPVVGDRPVQAPSPDASLDLPVVDLAALDPKLREAEAALWRTDEARRPFVLAAGPLLRALVVRLAADDHLVLLTLHHIVCDEWSLGVLARELGALYSAFVADRPARLPELPVQYADFAVYQQERLVGEALASSVSYWRRELAGAPVWLELPVDREPAVSSRRGAIHRFAVPAELCRGIEGLGREEGATLFITLLAALQLLLYRSSGQEDLIVGADMANRNRPEIEGLVGFFINLLPLRGDLTGNPPFRELLRRVRQTVLGAYLHQDVPFDRLVEELRPERVPDQTPFIRAVFSFRPAERQRLEMSGLEVTALEPEGELAKRDLTLFMERYAGGLSSGWAYRADLFDAGTIARLSGRFETLLASIVQEPDGRLDALELEPVSARRRREQARVERKASKLARLLELQAGGTGAEAS
ncbi:MAG TPA: amino acid adenylation domain-containing protein [Thermoanaerobaculia bacterium]|nr:amino acid adenylation domain-containing protein [Thermoanaerobaculia bacterium]